MSLLCSAWLGDAFVYRWSLLSGHGARSVAVSYKPSMLVTRVRLPACASSPSVGVVLLLALCCLMSGGCGNSPHWGLNPGPSVYKTDALPLSYRGVAFRRRGGIEPLHVSMPRELKSRPGTSPTHPGCRRAAPMCAFPVSCVAGWWLSAKATARGFEPLRAEPNGFLVHHLNHSVTLSCSTEGVKTHKRNCSPNPLPEHPLDLQDVVRSPFHFHSAPFFRRQVKVLQFLCLLQKLAK